MTAIIRAAIVGVAVAQLWQPALGTAQTSLLEVEKADVKLMQVNDDGGLVVRGGTNGAIPAQGAGFRLMWHPSKAAFRAGAAAGGSWDEENVGRTSVAMGAHTVANGEGATALGIVTVASGRAATAMGDRSRASGAGSTAMGFNTQATGENATAMGTEAKAIGPRSMATGYRTTAADPYATVMGSNAGTLGGRGSFVYGDASTETALVSITANEFAVRAAGGLRFRTSPNLATGCDLPAGSGTFNCTSSRLAKEGFEHLDGETILDQLAGIPVQRWRYRNTPAWHVGPTAEDFHAAFGLGEGSTTISTVDADGISLIAVQALERRTTDLKEENATLRAELDSLRLLVNRLSAPNTQPQP